MGSGGAEAERKGRGPPPRFEHLPREVNVEMEKLRHVVHEDPQLILGDAIHRLDGLDTASVRAGQVGGWVGGISTDGALLRGMPVGRTNLSGVLSGQQPSRRGICKIKIYLNDIMLDGKVLNAQRGISKIKTVHDT